MIKSGGSFFYKGKRCVIGAVISLKGLPYIVAASHIFHGVGEHVIVDGMEVVVKSILKDFDLALIELPPDCMVEITEFGSAAVLENASLVNDIHSITCRVVNAGTALLYLGFPCFDMPQPGDSGSPILQAGKVIGLISSFTLNNCTGTAISTSQFSSLFASI
ncbi:hypothetical protein BGV40_06495 [Methanosarcina sp. Ant1]|nr:hypothetical protein BGV40_06495 [Methanosarcina sp. Ant1]